MPIGSPNAGYRTFTTGDVLTAAQVQFNLQNQSIMFFANAAARDAALGVGVVQEGMFAYLADTNTPVFYDGAAWVSISSGGDLTGLTAGTGITIANAAGPVPTISVSDNALLIAPRELTLTEATAATGAINIDAMVAGVNIRTSNATANYQLNVRGNSVTTLNSIMSVGQSITITFESPNGSPAYYTTAFSIDGAAVTPKWLGGTAPSSGNINSTDVYMFQIRKTGAATFTVIASQSRFA